MSPEQCHGCLTALAEAGVSVAGDGAVGTGGAPVPVGTGGFAFGGVTGGTGTGGMGGTGGLVDAGGQNTGGASFGGAGSGGAAVEGSGGRGSGGSVGVGRGGGGSGGSVGATGGVPGSGGQGGVIAVGGGGAAGPGTGGAASGGTGVDPDLVLWYKFDEVDGTMAADSATAGGIAHPAALMTIGTGGTATFVTTKQVGSHAVSLTPATTVPSANGGYVSTTSLQSLVPNAVTVAVWVNLAANAAAQNWERVFDFGTGTSAPNMYLSARAADAVNTPVRFAITTAGHSAMAEQRLEGVTALSPNAWHHIAVVLPAGATFAGTLYIDGVAVATNSAMTHHPVDLGPTTNNWLGRSQFSDTSGTNPCFSGVLDDFRVYRRALSRSEIAALFALR